MTNHEFDEDNVALTTDLVVKRERDRWELVVVVDGQRMEHRFRPPCEVTVGREATNVLRIDHTSVSRRHARIVLHEGATVEDLGSSNGTRVDGRLLEAKQSAYLRPGSTLELGDVLVLLRAPDHVASEMEAQRGVSGPMAHALELASAATRTTLNVLICGPAGAGKRHLAERIAKLSPRSALPLLAIRVTEQMPSSLLFGASPTEPGILEQARAGIVILQSIESMPPGLQQRLEQTLSNSKVTRDDGSSFALEARIVATSRVSLSELRKSFDPTLLSRIAGVAIEVPALRDRRGEIRHLVETFLLDAPKLGLGVTDATLGLLLVHDWAENVRSLRETVHRASLRARTSALTPDDVGLAGRAGVSDSANPHEAEKKRILVALDLCAGNQTKAAKMLGISRRTLINRIEQLDLPRPRKSTKDE